jgi:hypothetical protein
MFSLPEPRAQNYTSYTMWPLVLGIERACTCTPSRMACAAVRSSSALRSFTRSPAAGRAIAGAQHGRKPTPAPPAGPDLGTVENN